MFPSSLLATLATAALAAAILLVLAWAHLVFWRWKLGVAPIEDALLFASTRDGWELALGRLRPRGPARRPPVLLVHGIAMNRQTFEFGVERYALAAHLARAGFDCFSLEHRGHGASRRVRPDAPRRWSLDTYLREDLPAAFEAIRRETGAEQVLYVGHSQGAAIGMAACALYPERIAAIVALAGPVHWKRQEHLRKLVLYRFGPRGGRFTRLLARMVAPFSGHWHPAVAEHAIQLRNVEPRIYRRILANGIENLQPGVLEQFATFIHEDSFRAMDGSVDYRAAIEACRQPALFVAAEKDGLAPPAQVEVAHRRWNGEKRFVLLNEGFGHADLLFGRRAPEVVFPVVRDFLLEWSEAVEEAAGPAR